MCHQRLFVSVLVGALAVAAGFEQPGPAPSARVSQVPTPVPSQDPDSPVLHLDVNYLITTAAPDGAGGWFIGGHFTRMAGQRRLRLAHVTADGQLDPT
jgi:hypothetical protein